MDLNNLIPAGLYVVAVSGGVDSVSLLDQLSKQQQLELIVAHFDHGIRKNSKQDRVFVESLARKYKIPFEYREANLGPDVSEELARVARYKFLTEVQKKHSAKAIITAHHQDDVLETAVINLLRGTGRLGLSSLKSNSNFLRPLLGISKQKILKYAKANQLTWQEDLTNEDTKYLRNYIRHEILPRFNLDERNHLLKLIVDSKSNNSNLDLELTKQIASHQDNKQLDRIWFTMLPHNVAMEVMASWLRQQGLRSFDSKTLERLVLASKTNRANTQVDVYNNYSLKIKPKHLALYSRDR